MCGRACVFNQAEAACVMRVCTMGACRAGAVDLDRRPENGCEYSCNRTGPEVCDGADNDCDGTIDNGFNVMTDARNCGACGRACNLPNAIPSCAMGQCGVSACQPGYANRNGDATDGCEWACGDATSGRTGPEVCDSRDNDCNGMIDDVVPRTCYNGPAGTSGVGVCRGGMQTCSAGTWSACVGEVRSATEVCDGTDNDCDGMTDESLSRGCYGGAAGTAGVGACRSGTQTCQAGTWGACSGEVRPGTEVCDGRDNDCDGMIDEGVTMPSTLRCNARGAEGQGVCAMARRLCRSAAGWGCEYPTTYRDLADEGYCDTLDNNCDGRVDEGCLSFLTTADLRIDQANGNSLQPQIAGGGNNLGVVYADRRNGESDIYFATSTMGGNVWSRDVRIDTGGAGSRSSTQPWLSWSGGGTEVLIGWSDYRSPTTDVDYRRVFANVSTNTGASFQTADRRVNTTQADDSFNVRVAQTPAGVLAVWESLLNDTRDRHIYSAFSSDRGLTWRPVVQVDRALRTSIASTRSPPGTQRAMRASSSRTKARRTDTHASWTNTGSRVPTSDSAAAPAAAEAALPASTKSTPGAVARASARKPATVPASRWWSDWVQVITSTAPGAKAPRSASASSTRNSTAGSPFARPTARYSSRRSVAITFRRSPRSRAWAASASGKHPCPEATSSTVPPARGSSGATRSRKRT
jgi:hypothetical protein